MLRDIDRYYLGKEEPVKSCLQALREYMLNYNPNIAEAWKYRMPLFSYKGQMFCHLWTDKKTGEPYIAFANGKAMGHPLLEQGSRSRMKIFRVDPNADLPLETIDALLKLAIAVSEANA